MVFISVLAVATVCAQAPASADKQLEVFGQKIHYLETGTGPTVILLHGLGGDVTNWALTVPALAGQYHVYALDQIGFGKSDKPLINYHIGTMVDFLNGFYQAVGIQRATLVGNSLGGWIAAAFALAHPDKVDKLVLVDAAGYSPERIGAPKLTRAQLAPLNASTLAELKQVMSLVFYNKALLTDAFLERAFADKLKRGDGYTINQFTEMVLRGDDYLDGQTKAIKAPTLVIWGREDGLTPLALGEAYAQDIPGARQAFLEKCGHVPQLECALPFQQALLKFLGAAASGQ
jgi:pimeloyl-ACP methyl ester carboxylesterase